MPFNHGYELTWETVAHALTKGLQLRTRGRLVEPSALTLAQNVEYPVTGGVQKRRGHTASDVITATAQIGGAKLDVTGGVDITPFQAKTLPVKWLPGYGAIETGHTAPHTTNAQPSSTLTTQPLALGGFSLNDNPVTWTGDQFVSSAGVSTKPVLMPVAKMQDRSSQGSLMQYAHSASGKLGQTVVAAYVEGTSGLSQSIKITAYAPDGAISGTQVITPAPGGNMSCIRVFPEGNNVWVFYCTDLSPLLGVKVTSAGSIGAEQTIVNVPTQFFDVALVPSPATSTVAYVVYQTSATSAKVAALDTAMAMLSNKALTTTTAKPTVWIWAMAVDVHPTSKEVATALFVDGIVADKARIIMELFPANLGLTRGYQETEFLAGTTGFIREDTSILSGFVANMGAPSIASYHGEFAKISIGFRYLMDTTEASEFIDVWASSLMVCDANNAGAFSSRAVPLTRHLTFRRTYFGGAIAFTAPVTSQYFPFYEVVGRAMCAGATPVVPLQFHGIYGSTMFGAKSYRTTFGIPVQPTVLLMGAHDKPVGRIHGGTAYCSYHSAYPVWPGNYVFTLGLPHSTIGLVGKAEEPQVRDLQRQAYQAPTVSTIDLDFIHPLSTAQLGKSVFIAGAQVWEYDGRVLTEAGFLLAPEFNIKAATGVVPLATPEFWRFEVTDVSEAGETTKSYSIPYKVTNDYTSAGGIEATLWCPPTWRATASFESYQSVNSTLYLNTIRSPATNGAGSLGTNQVIGFGLPFTFQQIAPSVLEKQAIHPSSTIGYLQPNPPPACQLVRAGNLRLWYAGGQVPSGSVTTSLLYQPGFLPGWNDYNTQIVDNPTSDVADMAFLQDAAFIFTPGRVGIINSDGPDNFSQGSQWPQPRQLTVGGTPYPNTAIATTQGIFFLANSGMRLINYAGGISDIGDADPELFANNIVAAVNFASKDQARWYSSDGDTVVLDYREGRFSTWTGIECSAAFVAGERAYVVRHAGYLWTEAYGAESVWQDDTTPIEMVIRTAWNPMGTGEIGYGRCRRIAWTGEFRGDHNVRMRVFYNESAVHEDEYTLNWATQGSLATSWGSDFWGFGAWGGSSTDKIWRWAWRPSRNKCSVIMFELSDLGANSAGFVPVCYGFEIGRRGGLDRVRMK